MAQELIYTSTERGLRPGTRGFCTVACTKGMKAEMVRLLESMSAYKDLYAIHDERRNLNPVCCRHIRYQVGVRNINILSRIGPTKADHTGRSNKIAHHILPGKREHVSAGPAAVFSWPEFFATEWNKKTEYIEEQKEVPTPLEPRAGAPYWEELTGDAGWAGYLAHCFYCHPNVPVYIVFEPGQDCLKLIQEAIRFVPVDKRWNVTFDTFFTGTIAGAGCLWRCCTGNNAELLREARRNPSIPLIDLHDIKPLKEDNTLIRCARNGADMTQQNTPQRSYIRDMRFQNLGKR